ncbi:MAG: PIN domain-containing protein [Chloroflexota bacterium]
MARVVVDTNVIFSAPVSGKESAFSEILLQSKNEFYACETTLVEIFKHKEKILKFSRFSDDDLVRFYYIILNRLNLYKETLIAPEHRKAAYNLCHDIDETDAPHVALTLELDAILWTGDKRLKEGLKKKGFKDFFVPDISR